MSPFDAEKAFGYIQQQLAGIRSTQEVDHRDIQDVKGMLAELFVIVKRLDEERLINHERVSRVIEDVEQLKQRFAN